MEILQLKYFLEVAKCESITRAAEALHVSQPSLSQTIGRLEKELDTKLFERRSRKLILTSKGRKFYDTAYSAVHNLERAKENLSRDGLQGNIVIGSYMPISILLPCIHEFARQNPDVRFTFLSVVNSFSVMPENLDALLLYGHSNAMNFNERMTIGNVEATMVVPAGRTPEELEQLQIDDLAEEDFVSLLQNDHYEEFYYNFYHRGQIPNIRYLTNSRTYKEEILEEGLGVGFSNHLLTDNFRKTGKYDLIDRRQVKGLYDPDICLAWRGDIYLSPAAMALKEFSKTWFGISGDGWST